MMKKTAVLSWLLLIVLVFSGCGHGDTEKKETGNDQVNYISKTEAKVFFHEISSAYRCELMMMNEEDLTKGPSSAYWEGLAPVMESLSFADLKADYINEEEKSALSTAYGADISEITFDIYRIADIQSGVNYLFGSGRIDVSGWDGDNLDIVSRGVYGTEAGYFLCAQQNGKKYDTQTYKIVSIEPGSETATVKAYAVSVDNISGNTVYDMGKLSETTDSSGNVTKGFTPIENAAIDQYDFSADFDTNMGHMGVNEKDLGIIDFVFSMKGISLYLDHAAAE